MQRIYLNKANINKSDIKVVENALSTNWVATYGKYIIKTEREIKKITKSKYVCLLNSGTSALHLALKSFNFQKKDKSMIEEKFLNKVAESNLN